MALNTKTFTQLVSDVATAMQASATARLNFTPGSVFLAICQATAGVVLWLQAIILQLLTLTRAATSSGADLDSWMADYKFPRLKASAATGQVTFSRFTPTLPAVIPINTAVQTSDGTQKFFVTIDAANAAYNAGLGGYLMAAGVAGVNVPVQAVGVGTQGNVLAGSITAITGSVPADTVTNASAFANGIDAESDPAFRARFPLYIASLSKATKAAVRYAVASVQQGVACTITENQDYGGTADMGYFYVVADDGTGYPSTSLLSAITAAVDAVRPLGSRYGVFAPVVATAAVSMTTTSAPGYAHGAVVAAVGTALTNFINALPLGTSLPYTQLASVAYSVPGVVNAASILLNGGTGDLAADQKTKLNAGAMTIA